MLAQLDMSRCHILCDFFFLASLGKFVCLVSLNVMLCLWSVQLFTRKSNIPQGKSVLIRQKCLDTTGDGLKCATLSSGFVLQSCLPRNLEINRSACTCNFFFSVCYYKKKNVCLFTVKKIKCFYSCSTNF